MVNKTIDDYRDYWKRDCEPLVPCSATQPMLLYIPPGKTVHISCQRHTEGHDLHGSNIVFC